jgi:hypothetical protein
MIRLFEVAVDNLSVLEVVLHHIFSIFALTSNVLPSLFRNRLVMI